MTDIHITLNGEARQLPAVARMGVVWLAGFCGQRVDGRVHAVGGHSGELDRLKD